MIELFHFDIETAANYKEPLSLMTREALSYLKINLIDLDGKPNMIV
jgi:hypothetical protein